MVNIKLYLINGCTSSSWTQRFLAACETNKSSDLTDEEVVELIDGALGQFDTDVLAGDVADAVCEEIFGINCLSAEAQARTKLKPEWLEKVRKTLTGVPTEYHSVVWEAAISGADSVTEAFNEAMGLVGGLDGDEE